MARTITEIATAMKTAFMEDATLRNKYGFADTAEFDNTFSIVSLERILIYIIASSIWALENIFDAFKSDITALIDNSVLTSQAWYYNLALNFQYGDALVFDNATLKFGYATVDTSLQIVKYAAVREVVSEGVTKLSILYSGTNKLALTADQQTAFEEYIRKMGAAGVHYLFTSQNPDALGLTINVYYDPLLIDSTGTYLSGTGVPVQEAIENYLNGIKYGGVFYSTKLIDAIQAVDAVFDVELTSTYWTGTAELRRKITAASGAFVLDTEHTTINYNID